MTCGDLPAFVTNVPIAISVNATNRRSVAPAARARTAAAATMDTDRDGRWTVSMDPIQTSRSARRNGPSQVRIAAGSTPWARHQSA